MIPFVVQNLTYRLYDKHKRFVVAHDLSQYVDNQPIFLLGISNYRKTSNIRRTLAGNKIVDHSDVVGASPVGAAPTTSSFST